jgi:SSS family solute:Na+ symporter
MMFLEMGYVSGFALAWWGLSQGIIILLITVSGWVIYRFRSTRCLTLPQFFEMRYSRKFRIFTGIVAFVAGIINFGIFPAVGARFFIHYCGLPESFLGIPMFPLVMILLLAVSLYFVQTGGQIAVIIADFFQGVYVNIIFMVMIFFLFFTVGWDQVTEALEQTPLKRAQEEIADVRILLTQNTLFPIEHLRSLPVPV